MYALRLQMVGCRRSMQNLGVGMEECSQGKVGWLWSGGHCPICPLHLRLFAQGSAHSTVELAEKHLHSAARLKRILPRCTGSQPATLTVSAVRSCTCVKTVASPARSLMLTCSTVPCTALLETVHPVSNHEKQINTGHAHTEQSIYYTWGRVVHSVQRWPQ